VGSHSGNGGMKDAAMTRSEDSTQLQAIIETPKGSRSKFKFDAAARNFKLSKVLPEGMVFPYDFGYLPATKAEDGDPLDILVLTDEPLFPGCLVDCRLLGVIEAEQEEGGERARNDRLIAAASASLLYSGMNSLEDLNPVVLKEIQEFFVNYQRVRGVKVTILGRKGPEQARKLIRIAADAKHAA
jgi:inorganic pyrophosphatase